MRSTIASKLAPKNPPATVYSSWSFIVETSTKYVPIPANIIEDTELIMEIGIKILRTSTRLRIVARKNPVKHPISISSSMGAVYYV
jgi:hypothetical protein